MALRSEIRKYKHMPISLSTCRKLDKSKHGLAEDPRGSRTPDVTVSFQVLLRLLLGHVYTYTDPAVLLSTWGWSMVLESINANDPIDVPINTTRMECGVPARHCLRRTRIIDGPTDASVLSFTTAKKLLGRDAQICHFRSPSTAEKALPWWDIIPTLFESPKHSNGSKA